MSSNDWLLIVLLVIYLLESVYYYYLQWLITTSSVCHLCVNDWPLLVPVYAQWAPPVLLDSQNLKVYIFNVWVDVVVKYFSVFLETCECTQRNSSLRIIDCCTALHASVVITTTKQFSTSGVYTGWKKPETISKTEISFDQKSEIVQRNRTGIVAVRLLQNFRLEILVRNNLN